MHLQGISIPTSPNESENLHVGRKATPSAPRPSIPQAAPLSFTKQKMLWKPLSVNRANSSSFPWNGGLCWVERGATRVASTTCPPSNAFYRPATGSWLCNSGCGVREDQLKRIGLTSGCSSSRGNQPPCSNQAALPEVAFLCHPFATFTSFRSFRDPAGSQLLPQEIPPSSSRPPNVRSCQMEVVGGYLGCHKWANISLSPYRATSVGFHLLPARPQSSDYSFWHFLVTTWSLFKSEIMFVFVLFFFKLRKNEWLGSFGCCIFSLVARELSSSAIASTPADLMW